MPALSHERLTRHLREGGRGGVFFLYGEEDHLKEMAARELIDAHLDPATRDFNLDEIHGDDATPEALGSVIQTPPMMAEWRVVVVRAAEKMAVSSTLRGIMEQTAASPPPGLALLLIADTGGSKAKVWKTLEKTATAVSFPRLSETDLPGWLLSWAEAESLDLEMDAARAMAAAIGSDLATLARELEKLRDFVGERARITIEDVKEVVGVIPRQDRWKWMDMVAERRFEPARAGLPILLESGDSGVGLTIGLANQLLRVAVFLAGGKQALDSALPSRQRWLARTVPGQARHWDLPAIEQALNDLRRADRLLKSAPLSEIQVMEELLLRLQHVRKEAA